MRIGTLSVVAVGLLTAACGNTDRERAVTGALGGAAAGALIGGPVATTGYVLDESAEQKVSRLGDAFVNRPIAAATGTQSGPYQAAAPAERSGAADVRSPVTATEVHDKLHDEGYSRVYNIRRDGDSFLARGERGGRAYDIEVDARTGRIIASNEAGQPRMSREMSGGEPMRGTSARGDARGMVSEQQVRNSLRQAGYSQVNSVQRQGDAYQAQARWGNTVYDVRVDARTGRVISSNQSSAAQSGQGSGATTAPGSQSGTGMPTGTQSGAMSEGQIRNALQSEGYSQISNLRREGDAFVAQAQRNGQNMMVRVDAQSGRILQATPAGGGQAPQPGQGGQNQGG
jgi:predicted small secreted protein